MKIVHIAAHMGAGAGKAISGVATADSTWKHQVILTDRPKKTDHVEHCVRCGVRVAVCPDFNQAESMIREADIAVVNWWHHPSAYRLLLKLCEIPARVVLWSHVNGLTYPQLKPDFVKRFDACMFTSEASFQNPNWSEKERDDIQTEATLVYGTGDFRPEIFPPKKNYRLEGEANIGYVGSLDYAKLNPDFAQWLKAAADKNGCVRFVIAGDVQTPLLRDVERVGLSDRVEFLGYCGDVPHLLQTFDCFVYPLNPFHFATTENALLEAMVAGLPVIASNGVIEASIITDGQTGLLASDAESFADKLDGLLGDECLRRTIGQAARAYVKRTYNTDANLLRFHAALEKVLAIPKRTHNFREVIGETPFQWLLMGCGEKEKDILQVLSQCEPGDEMRPETARYIAALARICKGHSKGSVMQFHQYCPHDEKLDRLAWILTNTQEVDQ